MTALANSMGSPEARMAITGWAKMTRPLYSIHSILDMGRSVTSGKVALLSLRQLTARGSLVHKTANSPSLKWDLSGS